MHKPRNFIKNFIVKCSLETLQQNFLARIFHTKVFVQAHQHRKLLTTNYQQVARIKGKPTFKRRSITHNDWKPQKTQKTGSKFTITNLKKYYKGLQVKRVSESFFQLTEQFLLCSTTWVVVTLKNPPLYDHGNEKKMGKRLWKPNNRTKKKEPSKKVYNEVKDNHTAHK